MFTYISLFSGCGGFDLGMPPSCFRCLAAYDINQNAVSVYNKNLLPVAVKKDLSMPFTDKHIKPDVILSGAPCQGFSTAGKRKIDDHRNNLFIQAVNIALQMQPKVYAAENVAGILSGIHKIYFMDRAIDMFQNNGYKTHLFTVDCRDLGMAQMRKRAILIAWRTNKNIHIPQCKNTFCSLQDVIGCMPYGVQNHDVNYCAAHGRHKLIATSIQAGQKLSNVRGGERSVHTWQLPDVFGKTTEKEKEVLESIMRLRRKSRKRDWGDADPVSRELINKFVSFDSSSELSSLLEKKFIKLKGEEYDLANTFNGKYRRLRWDEPSLTVDTRFGSPTLFLHPSEDRAFTVREAARLQGFPDDFVFYGPIQAQYALVGNAVPLPLGRYISDIIFRLL